MKINSYLFPNLYDCKIAIIGLGYVGLPLAIEFSKNKECLLSGKKLNRKILAFDINNKRIDDLKKGIDYTNQISKEELVNLDSLNFTSDENCLSEANVFIVTVPTPVNSFNIPDLKALENASRLVGNSIAKKNTDKNPIVIYESTVYPGATEEVCIPILIKYSKLIFNKDFFCGFSPERINPGDKEHVLRNIVKVTSGSNKYVSEWIDKFYGSIITAGTCNVDNIKIAETAKIIENTQRDINIALMNELSIICNLLDIDTLDVIDAASTKWNFLPFKPGLVGGHCIGVDPYYLTYKSKQLGYNPLIVSSGRKINDEVAKRLVESIVLKMVKKSLIKINSKILIMGITFKEDCPDIRNSKVFDILGDLSSYPFKLKAVDPYYTESNFKEHNIEFDNKINFKEKYDVILLLVAHKEFKKIKIKEWNKLINKNGIFFDLKGIIPRELNPLRI